MSVLDKAMLIVFCLIMFCFGLVLSKYCRVKDISKDLINKNSYLLYVVKVLCKTLDESGFAVQLLLDKCRENYSRDKEGEL